MEFDALAREIRAYSGPPIRLMEVCGTHTRRLAHFGIPSMLSPNVELVSGPGCPVCVTPAGMIDRAAELAMEPGATVLSFGDMFRVPGRKTSLAKAKAEGGSVVLIYSPMDALKYALSQPDRMFYVAAVGFETTLPLYALLIQRLMDQDIRNVRLLLSAKALIPALQWICENNPRIDGLIGPGHVSAILGCRAYDPLCARYGMPMAVAGFNYEHLIAAIADLIRQIKRGTAEVHNLYTSAVSREGNAEAQRLIGRFFIRVPSVWRGLGRIEASAYALSSACAAFDAGLDPLEADEPELFGCLCGEVIAGRARPADCINFGANCTPVNPLGPCMVSGEGACGIQFGIPRA